MKRLFLIFLGFLSLTLSAQQGRAFFRPQNNYLQREKYKSMSYQLYPSKRFTSMRLKNGQEVFRFGASRFTLQKGTDTTWFDLMGGATPEGDLFLILDRNTNQDFTDDSVYLLQMAGPEKSREAYIRAWPVILLDSVRIRDANGAVHYFDMVLRPALFKDAQLDHFHSAADVQAYRKNFELQLFQADYLQARIDNGTVAYELNIDLDPLQVPFYSLLWKDPLKRSLHNVSLYKRLGEKDTLLYTLTLGGLIKSIREERVYELHPQRIKFTKLSLDSGYIDYEEMPQGMVAGNKLPAPLKKITGLSLPTGRAATIATKSRKYTILFFSGSWCRPCHEVQPLFQKLFEQYRERYHFITITCEKDWNDALLYYRSLKPAYPFLYEKLESDRAQDLSVRLKVRAFPSFVLLDQKGEVLYQGVAQEALEEIQKRIR